MLEQMFRNMTPVVKNLLIINVLVFLVTLILESRGLDLNGYLALHHYTSPYFQPYQFVTSIFAHGSFFHLLANMLGLVSFGSQLENYIGSKRFLILYAAAGLAGGLIYTLTHLIQLYIIGCGIGIAIGDSVTSEMLPYIDQIESIISSSAVGASGAVFGVFAAIYKYFPSTEVMLLFPPIPVKIKWLFAILMIGSLVLTFFPFAMQGIAHMAHFGGGLAGLILVYIWQKDRTNFY
ncbi:MAG: membrane associated rhomboid family serine protease [Flavobacteriales bacterium]|jgi:membrane associated rhomboid family serine protease